MSSSSAEFTDPFPRAHDARRGAWVRVVVGLVVLIALGVAAALYPFGGPGCGFRLATGMPCPGCGMTRSMIHIARGDLLASVAFHPLGLPLAVGGLSVFAGALRGAFTGADPLWDWMRRRPVLVVWTAVALLFGTWIVRTFVVPEWASDPIGPPFQFSLPSR